MRAASPRPGLGTQDGAAGRAAGGATASAAVWEEEEDLDDEGGVSAWRRYSAAIVGLLEEAIGASRTEVEIFVQHGDPSCDPSSSRKRTVFLQDRDEMVSMDMQDGTLRAVRRTPALSGDGAVGGAAAGGAASSDRSTSSDDSDIEEIELAPTRIVTNTEGDQAGAVSGRWFDSVLGETPALPSPELPPAGGLSGRQTPPRPRSPQPRAAQPSEIAAQWKCSACTLLNDAVKPFCDVCQAPRPLVEQPAPRTTGLPRAEQLTPAHGPEVLFARRNPTERRAPAKVSMRTWTEQQVVDWTGRIGLGVEDAKIAASVVSDLDLNGDELLEVTEKLLTKKFERAGSDDAAGLAAALLAARDKVHRAEAKGKVSAAAALGGGGGAEPHFDAESEPEPEPEPEPETPEPEPEPEPVRGRRSSAALQSKPSGRIAPFRPVGVCISGPTGLAKSSKIYGSYVATERQANGRPVYQAVDGPAASSEKYIWYTSDSTWFIGSEDSIGGNIGFAHTDGVAAEMPTVAARSARVAWKVHNDGAWEKQADIESVVIGAEHISVFGVTGDQADIVNGVYQRTSSVMNGHVVYVSERSASLRMWLCGAKGSWIISDDPSGNTGYATLHSSAAGPELADDGSHWEVWDADTETWNEQRQAGVIVVGCQRVLIAGVNAIKEDGGRPQIDGIFCRTDSWVNQHAVYEREDGTEIGMWHAAGTWYIGDLKWIAGARGYAALDSTAFGPELAEPDVHWKVLDGTIYVHQRHVSVVPVGAPGVLICGATESQGQYSTQVNGTFMQTSTVLNSHVVYAKENGNDKRMWYTNGCWWIGLADSVGQSRGFAYLESRAPGPDLASGDWYLSQDDGSGWAPRSSVSALPVGVPSILVCGAAGKNADVVNGVYHQRQVGADCHVNARSVYVKENDSEHAMWYAEGSWMIGSVGSVGGTTQRRRGCWAQLTTHQIAPDLANHDAHWKVWDGSFWREQPRIQAVPVGAPTVIFAGAAGPNADTINGSFLRADSALNQHATYEKVGAPSLQMCFDGADWVIGKKRSDGAIDRWASLSPPIYVLSSAALSPDMKPEHIHWQVRDGSAWKQQTRITATPSGSECVLITGATGKGETSNGAYRRKPDVIVNGRATYEQEGRPYTSLWYASSGTWWVGMTDSLGESKGFLQLESTAVAPELSRDLTWEGHDGSNWSPQPDAMMIPVGAPSISISGATGSSATRINGVFSRTTNVNHGRAVYEREGDSSTGIWWDKKWWLGQLTEMSASKGYATLQSSAAGPELMSRHEEWKVWNGSEWELQRLVVVPDSDRHRGVSIPRRAGRARTFGGRTFATSNFLRIYSETRVPKGPMQMGVALNGLVKGYCRHTDTAWAGIGQRFFEQLEAEAMQNAQELSKDIPQAAQRMWTSAKQLGGKEFCFLLNFAIREDDPELIEFAAVLVRAVNQLCVTSGHVAVMHPPTNVCYRGGGFDDTHREFFSAGLQFRQPAYVATSFSRAVADRFIARARGPRILWLIRIDPVRKCDHVNLIASAKSHVAGEEEYLFTPYSAFTVLSAKWNAGTAANPHIIELQAAVDNKAEPEDLPLAPWS